MWKIEELTEAIDIIDPSTRDKTLEKYAGDCAMRNGVIERASRLVADYARVCQMVFDGQRSALVDRGFDELEDFLISYDELKEALADASQVLHSVYGCAVCGDYDEDVPCPYKDKCTDGEMFIYEGLKTAEKKRYKPKNEGPLTEEEICSDAMEGKPIYCVNKKNGHGEWCLVSRSYIYDNGGFGVRVHKKMQTHDMYSRPPKGEKG